VGTPASSATKTGRHDIAAILLKVVLKDQQSNQNQIKCKETNISIQTKAYFIQKRPFSTSSYMKPVETCC
jgi:hypothetical protein